MGGLRCQRPVRPRALKLRRKRKIKTQRSRGNLSSASTHLDVRTAQEYSEKHIPGAINIANESIGTEDISELPDKDQLILVYCRSGNRSKQASEKLVKLGYTNIIEIGGINSWPGETVAGDK
ncbi:MAG: rhodanese-like domain-containing protein [Oscillospiraceae bacterium]|nr:rhodanese-like domain-containing protein [Oscillospiraceae bacterium]